MGLFNPKQPKRAFDTDPGSSVPPGRRRSGSGLGATTSNPGTSTGLHFGHHKTASRAPDNAAGMAANFNQPPAHQPGGQSTGAIGMAGSDLLTYFPPLECFQSNTMDIYASNGNPPPPAGQPRTANVNMMITGVFPEGSRNRGQTAEDYTHIILCDAFIEVHDGYTGNTQAANANGDILRIPSGVANYWVAVFVFVTQIPGVGRKKVVLADRRGVPGDFTKIL